MPPFHRLMLKGLLLYDAGRAWDFERDLMVLAQLTHGWKRWMYLWRRTFADTVMLPKPAPLAALAVDGGGF
jgi:hypothetical protein